MGRLCDRMTLENSTGLLQDGPHNGYLCQHVIPNRRRSACSPTVWEP